MMRAQVERFAAYSERHPIRARLYVAAAGIAYLYALLGIFPPTY